MFSDFLFVRVWKYTLGKNGNKKENDTWYFTILKTMYQ